MNLQVQIKGYIASQPETKRSEMLQLHSRIFWKQTNLLYGSNQKNKVVSSEI